MAGSRNEGSNYGIHANNVKAKVLAVGPNARAQAYDSRQDVASQPTTVEFNLEEEKFLTKFGESRDEVASSRCAEEKILASEFVSKKNTDYPMSSAVSPSHEVGHKQALNSAEQALLTSKSSRRLIIFVHGLAGAARSTWGLFPNFLENDMDIAKLYDLKYYSYPTSLFRLPFFSPVPRIQDLAAGLSSQIRNRYAQYDEITLACHSMGGLVARKYLIDEKQMKRKTPTIKLALFAVPNNGAALASYAKNLSWKHWQIGQMCRDSDFVDEINESWARLGLLDSVPTKYYVAAQDRIVDRTSAKSYWGNNQVEVVVNRGHTDIVKPVSSEDDIVIFFKNFLLSDAPRS